MTKYEVAQHLRDARLAAGLSRSEVAKTINRTAKAARWWAVIYSVSVTGIIRIPHGDNRAERRKRSEK